MACPRQMCNKLMCIAISISVVTSQVTGDVFKNLKSSRACFGIDGIHCTANVLACGDEENILINDVAYLGTETAVCAGVGTCGTLDNYIICCTDETDVTVHNDAIDNHRFEIYKTCSGKQKSCKVNVADIGVKTGRVTSVTVNYHCIKNKSVINYRENITKSKKIVHIMYNGQQDDYVNKDYYCFIRAASGIDLYSVDIRLQKQDSQCTSTTLKWGHNQFEDVEQCVRSGDNSTLKKMNKSKNINDMWVQLSIQDDIPTMVWIAAKATSGKVNVKCGQINVNTQGTTSTLSTTSHTTTINTRTHSVSSAIASKSVSGSTTVTVLGMPPTAATTVYLHEPSISTTVVATGPHSRNTVSDDDKNIGTIVGPVIGIIIIAVLVAIGLIFLRRRRAKQQSSKSTTTRAYEGLTGSSKRGSDNKAYDIISDYDLSKPIVLPTGNKAANEAPIALFSFGDSYKQGNGNAISDVDDDIYSDINHKDMVSYDSSRYDISESDYDHLHNLKASGTCAQSGNVYSHLKTSLRNTSPRNDDYDHFGCNKPSSLEENTVSIWASNDYDHLSSAKTNNATDCNQPITTYIQQATTQDATVKTSDNSNISEGCCTDTTSQQTEPSCEYAKVKHSKPVASSDYEMAGILNDVEV